MRARKTCLLGLSFFVALQLLFLCMPRAHAQEVFNPATDVFWECGGESGSLKPQFEIAGPVGEGSHSDSFVRATTEQARSGTYSIKQYIRPPTQSDGQRRLSAREYSVFSEVSPSPTEYYFSFWRYFPDNVADADGSEAFTTNQWTNLGGIGIRYGPPSDRTRYKQGVVFGLTDPVREEQNHNPATEPRRFYVKLDRIYSRSTGPGRDYDEHITNWCLNSTYLNKWLHFQIYLKFAKGTSGIWKAWISDGEGHEEMVKKWTNIPTDPRSDLSRWNSEGNEFYSQPYGHYAKISLYQRTPSPERWAYADDAVLSYAKVPDSYRVGYKSVKWENGFESGNFSAWDGTQISDPNKAWVTVASTYSYTGTYSANFTTDGSYNSYAKAMHIIQPVDEVFQRSHVRFEDLPDTNNTRIWVFRVARGDDKWIASAGVNRSNGNYYWIVGEASGRYNTTQDAINADQWYELEFHFNATTNGRARLWVNGILMCEITGDFSSLGKIQRVYPYIYCSRGAQRSAKTVYHDNYRIDDTRISGGTSATSQFSAYVLTGVEDEPVGFSPLENVRINRTRSTDSSGFCEWENLACNKVTTFVVERPAGYYPAWVLNVEGSYSWNGTHFILSHNVTQKQTGPIEIYFSPTEEVYIKSSTRKLTSVFYNDFSQNPHTLMRLNLTADVGVTSRLEIYTADEGHPRPYKIEGATDWSYDSESKILTVWFLHTSDEEAEIEWRGAAMGQ